MAMVGIADCNAVLVACTIFRTAMTLRGSFKHMLVRLILKRPG